MPTRDASLPIGLLAQRYGRQLGLRVLESRAGFYLGTADADGPFSRESVEYWPEREQADAAMKSHAWTQRVAP